MKKVFQAHLIYPYGKNPKYNTPILGWIESNKKCYSPEYFFEKIVDIGNIWKDEIQTSRFFTLYNFDNSSLKVKIYRAVDSEKFNTYPLACFREEGLEEQPVTFINKEANYGKFIYAISSGNLKKSMDILEENLEEILEGYPCFDIMITNLIKVNESHEALKWLSLKIEEKKIDNFDELSVFYKELFLEKKNNRRFEKGILSILSKTFSYVPREL